MHICVWNIYPSDCPAVTRVWSYVPPCGQREKAGGGRVGFGSLCQRNHRLRDEEPPPDCHPALPLEGNRLHIHRGKKQSHLIFAFYFTLHLTICCVCPSAAQTDHRVRWAQWEKAQFCNRELKNSTVPPQPLLRTAQISQRDDVTTTQPHHDTRWDCVECIVFHVDRTATYQRITKSK